MTVKKSLACAAIGLAAGLSQTAIAAESDWFRQAAISPDGDTIAFSYLGNIFTVPAGGGTATPLTTHAAWEGHPVWSRDGSMIAFASDRYGNKDIFVMPATGGATKRLTYHPIFILTAAMFCSPACARTACKAASVSPGLANYTAFPRTAAHRRWC